MVLLQTLDHLWREHLVVLEQLRSVIGFRSYGQRDPLNEYKSESFQLFETMLVNMREAVTGQLMHLQRMPDDREDLFEPVELPPMQAHHVDPFTGQDELAMADAALAAGTRPESRASERRAPVQTRRATSLNPRRSRRPGARSRATPPAPAVRVRSTSIVTASTIDAGASCDAPRLPCKERAFLCAPRVTACRHSPQIHVRREAFANSTSHLLLVFNIAVAMRRMMPLEWNAFLMDTRRLPSENVISL